MLIVSSCKYFIFRGKKFIRLKVWTRFKLCRQAFLIASTKRHVRSICKRILFSCGLGFAFGCLNLLGWHHCFCGRMRKDYALQCHNVLLNVHFVLFKVSFMVEIMLVPSVHAPRAGTRLTVYRAQQVFLAENDLVQGFGNFALARVSFAHSTFSEEK